MKKRVYNIPVGFLVHYRGGFGEKEEGIVEGYYHESNSGVSWALVYLKTSNVRSLHNGGNNIHTDEFGTPIQIEKRNDKKRYYFLLNEISPVYTEKLILKIKIPNNENIT